MLDAGKPVSEFLIIIDNQSYWWREVDQNSYRFLFPETLFRPSHWDRYLANVPTRSNGTKRSKPDKYKNFYL